MSAATKQFAFRLSADLVERIDKFAEMRARIDGRPCDRSTALRVLLEKALAPPADEVITGLVTDAFAEEPKSEERFGSVPLDQGPRLLHDRAARKAKKKKPAQQSSEESGGLSGLGARFDDLIDHDRPTKKTKKKKRRR